MDADSYPTSIAEIPTWRKHHGTTAEEAARRLVQFVILTSISSSTALASRIAFKGGNALRFIYGNKRSTLDLDFSAEGDFPDSPQDIKWFINQALRTAEGRYQIKARCQSIHREPPGPEKTRPTYKIKVCYQLLGDRHYHTFDEHLDAGKHLPKVVEVEISLNDVVCETRQEQLAPDTMPLRVCTLDDILAEKLRALLQQVPRNRSRPQDVFDIASMIRRHRGTINRDNISMFLSKNLRRREIDATKAAFNTAVRRRAEAGYKDEVQLSQPTSSRSMRHGLSLWLLSRASAFLIEAPPSPDVAPRQHPQD